MAKISGTRILLGIAFALCLPIHAQQLGQETLQGNEQELANDLVHLIKKVSLKRDPQGPIQRLNQSKSQGCFLGTFRVLDNIPHRLKHGMFSKPNVYPMYARFANASTQDDSEQDLRGLSLRVENVEGEMIWGQQGKQDFLMNSYPVLFAESPEVFYDFIQAQVDDGILGFFLNPFDSHYQALAILLSARDRPNSLFDIRYWSTTAFRLGPEQQAVKYSVTPCSSFTSSEPNEYSANYLKTAMSSHLANTDVCFDFALQMQTDPLEMPIEDPTVEWDENESPFIDVAKISIQDQDFMSPQAMSQCEAASFNPWQSLIEHKPLGRINRVRRLVYEALAELRMQRRKTLAEPVKISVH